MRQCQPNSTWHQFCMHPTFSKSVRSLQQYQNSIIPSWFSLNLALKSTDSITKNCCWYRNCWQWSTALLETCLSSSKTVHQNIALMTHRGSVPWDIPFINPDMWPVNLPDLNPVYYYNLWYFLSEIQVAIQQQQLLYNITTGCFQSRPLFHLRRSRGEIYSRHGGLYVSVSLAAFARYCTDLDVSWGNGRGAL